ncbi:hypothetical protein LSAT2_001951 [Lamellibrachia satsuma]|nr:hypothetical protein LSAT2_001951 [Lamellibrachia satsuma]
MCEPKVPRSLAPGRVLALIDADEALKVLQAVVDQSARQGEMLANAGRLRLGIKQHKSHRNDAHLSFPVAVCHIMQSLIQPDSHAEYGVDCFAANPTTSC